MLLWMISNMRYLSRSHHCAKYHIHICYVFYFGNFCSNSSHLWMEDFRHSTLCAPLHLDWTVKGKQETLWNEMEKFQWSLKNGEIEDVKRFVEEDGVDVNMVRLTVSYHLESFLVAFRPRQGCILYNVEKSLIYLPPGLWFSTPSSKLFTQF